MLMKEFALLFRQPRFDRSKITPSEMQALVKKWDDWKAAISKEGKMASEGQRLAAEGKVLKTGGVITKSRESRGGYYTRARMSCLGKWGQRGDPPDLRCVNLLWA